jgi:hypothetical protein
MAVLTRREGRAHEELEETIDLRLAAERLPALSTYERSEVRRRILALLHERVVDRLLADDLFLFSDVRDRVGDELMKASMSYDQLAVRHWIELLAAADVTDTARVQALLYGLDALMRVQTWKARELRLAGL